MYRDSERCYYDEGTNCDQNIPAQLGYFIPLNGLYCIAIPPSHHQREAAHSPRLSRQTLW